MHLRGEIDAAARLVAAVAGVATTVAVLFAADELRDLAALLAVVTLLAAVLTATVPNVLGPLLGLAGGVVAVFLIGDDLFHPEHAPSPTQALAGIGVPTTARNFAWLGAFVLIIAAAVAAAGSRWRSKPRFAARPLVIGGVAAVVLLGAAAPGAIALAGATRDRLADAGHTTATGPAPNPADQGAPTWQHQRWQTEPANIGDHENMAVVPERGVVVQAAWNINMLDTVRVFDARTGAERWHAQVDTGSVFVDARDGRILVVTNPSAVVFDLVSGRALGDIPLPAATVGTWRGIPGQIVSGVPTTGRTVVVGNEDTTPTEVLAIDVVALHATVIDDNPAHCAYTVPQGSGDAVEVIRSRCARPARLEVTGDRLGATIPLPLSADDAVTQAYATDKGAVLAVGDVGDVGSTKADLVLAVVAGRPDPVVRETPGDATRLDLVVLPATPEDPQRILLTRGPDDWTNAGQTFELIDTAGAKLPAPQGDQDFRGTAIRPVFGVGDRVYLPSLVTMRGMLVLDAHTLRTVGSAPDPCEVESRAGAGSIGVVQCSDGRLLAFD